MRRDSGVSIIFTLLALKGEQVVSERTGIRGGRQTDGLGQGRDDERRF